MRVHFDHISLSFFPGIISASIVEAVVPHYGPMARSLSVTFYISSELIVSSYFPARQPKRMSFFRVSGSCGHVLVSSPIPAG